MQELLIDAELDAPGLVLNVAGELDLATAPRLRERLKRALDAGADGIVVDLTGVTFIDSVSLATLVAARTQLQPDGRLAIVATTPFVLLVLQASGLDRVFDVFGGRREAEAFAFGRR
jgi:anti-sigma B factor antagonist